MREFGMKNTIKAAVLFAVMGMMACGCNTKSENGSKRPELVDTKSANQESAMIAGNGDSGTVVEPQKRSLRLMQFALILLNARYVEPERLNWRKMTVYGIDALQKMVPEVVARFDRRIDDNPTTLNLRVGLESRYFNIGKVDSLGDAWQMSEDAYNFIYQNLVDPKDADELEYAMINGMFSTLDPHTNLLPPYLFEEMMTGNVGFGGCGFVVGVRDDNLTVISPLEGAPAWRAGIKAGDIILRIDDESTENMPLQDAVDRMRGDVGTQVTLYVKRRGWTEAQPIVITREKIQVKSVTSEALKKDNVGYIKLKSFDQSTGEEVRQHLAALHKAMPKMKGLVFDLRNNSGGLLEQSIAVAEQFLKKGDTIVSVEGATKADRSSTKARIEGPERDYPIVILINEGTASASEIVSGALQFHDRAVIVGERSFGKGSVQILKDNHDGSAIKITSAQYLTPGDISIQGVGIVPDIQLLPTFVSENEPVSLYESQKIQREDDLNQSLHSTKTIKRTSSQLLHYIFKEAEEDEKKAKELGISKYDIRTTENYYEDDVTRFAISLLKQAASSKKSEILSGSTKFFEQHKANYEKELTAAFDKLKVDWKPSHEKTCESFDWGVRLGDAEAKNGETMVFPSDGEEKQLVMWVKNTCATEEMSQLLAILDSNNVAFDEREFIFGRLKPGEQREWPLKIKIPRSIPTRDDAVNIKFLDSNHSLDNAIDKKASFTASIVRQNRPQFAYTYWIDDIARGNGDGALSRGESINMYVWVKNIGKADSDKVNIHIANESGSGVLLQQGRASIEKLAAGESKLVLLKFDISKDKPQKPPSKRIKRDRPFNPDEAFLNLTISDSAFDSQLIQPVYLPIAQNVVNGTTRETSLEDAGDAIATLKAGSRLYSRQNHGVEIGNMVAAEKVRVHNLDGDKLGVCWKEGDLNPCAFAEKDAVSHDAVPAPGQEKLSNVTVNFNHEAPRIVFEDRSHTEKEATVTIVADLSDNEALRDYEAYVWTMEGLQVKVEKLDYGMISGREKRIAIETPLKNGDNSLVIVARDSLDTEAVEVFHINRQ